MQSTSRFYLCNSKLCGFGLAVRKSRQLLTLAAEPTRSRLFSLVANHLIRTAIIQDQAEIARLSTELGYPATPEAIGRRLERLLGNINDTIIVAESGGSDSALIGWIHGTLSQYLESDFRVEIAGLIVARKFYRQGIGRALVASVEAWGLKRGAVLALVRCRTTRAEAHRFYESLGYVPAKMQTVFRKALPGARTKE